MIKNSMIRYRIWLAVFLLDFLLSWIKDKLSKSLIVIKMMLVRNQGVLTREMWTVLKQCIYKSK